MEKKFSIIVPAYNAEEYLERCIASMANQNFPYDEYEVIVVNDGSTDGTLDLLNDLCLKYSFLRYVTTVNGGLSRARNRGIEEAVADYLLFVDSDDSIKSHSLTQIYDELIKEEPWLKPYLVPKCERLGYCDEDKSCGRKPKLEEIISK